MSPAFENIEVMIWGKTYPELSARHVETVCTGGIRLDTGAPVRLYPVPFRYMAGAKYRLYDLISVSVSKSPRDPRPESLKIQPDSIDVVGHVGPDQSEWAERRRFLHMDTTWHYPGMVSVHAAQADTGRSMAFVQPDAIVGVEMVEKDRHEQEHHEEKWRSITSQTDLFSPDYKELEWIPVKYRVQWRCSEHPSCHCFGNPHDMMILDWGLIELGRREGWGAAHAKLETLVDASVNDLRFFLGNMFSHPSTFSVVGLWYPRLRDQLALI
ncbi:MAG: hypothetical protein R3B35_14015 [Gemmatimonadales bacterium]